MVGVMCVGCGKKKYDFTDDVVLVTLTAEASAKANTDGYMYTIEDFAELNLSSVNNMFTNPGNKIRMLSLQLAEPSHKRVLEYIVILEKRDDIERASPNRILTGV